MKFFFNLTRNSQYALLEYRSVAPSSPPQANMPDLPAARHDKRRLAALARTSTAEASGRQGGLMSWWAERLHVSYRNMSNHKLQTNGEHHSTQLDEIWNMVISTASFMHFLSNVYNLQKTLWNRSNRKLQTKEDHHSTHLDEIWIMVLSTASFMHFSNKVYTKFKQRLYQV